MKDNALPKMLVVSLITGVVLFALMLVNGVVGERQRYRREAVKSIEESTAGQQTVIGPVLVRPYKQTTVTMEDDGKGGKKRVERTASLAATSFPLTLNVGGNIAPEERRRGLYKVAVYTSAIQLRGAFEVSPVKTEGNVQWDEPYLAIYVSDVRGLVSSPKVAINGKSAPMMQGGNSNFSWHPNLRIPLKDVQELNAKLDFAIDLDLAGTERLSFAPAGDANHIEMASTWPSPQFAGRFLPRTREVSDKGFRATWEVPSLATSTQTQMYTPETTIDTVDISLLASIDPYKLSDRSIKYGVLFVTLSFAGFFLFEMLTALRIHPMQYLFVGFGLAIFFLLLISFSEHMAFGLAYILASLACIGLLSFYLCYVLRSIARGLGFGAILTTFYAAVYGLLINEDNALVLGSLLLFFVLAIVMIVTRKVDWYKRELNASPLSGQIKP